MQPTQQLPLLDLSTATIMVEEIPMISGVHEDVRRLIEQEEGGAEEISRLVERDATVSQVVIHAANVAFYSPSRTVKTVNRAIALMGLNSVVKLIRQSTVSAALSPLAPPQMAPFWRRVYSTAQTARLLAVSTRTAFPEEAFTAALMQSVGQAMMMVKFPAEYEQVHERMRDPEAQLLDVERDIFGATQVDLGYLLTRRWRLDEMLVKLVRYQFEPEKAEELMPFSVMLYLAQTIVSGLGIGLLESYSLRNSTVRPATWKTLGWNQLEFEPICKQVVNSAEEFDGFYEVISSA
ncbi:MAG TPA: HDOD domain-containing protein [Myxococcales bacterium]|nr:HDOD domain-containing protein [Myxococcales bacterium]HIN86569.1 HDOD domain-containing protein [Myxococcales bacterium]